MLADPLDPATRHRQPFRGAGRGSAPGGADPAPNIVFILIDDLGWTDLGCQGSGYYETPNIDRLAAQGVRFLNHYHAQNCTPTRAAIMTGQYPTRTGIYGVGTLARGDEAHRKMEVPENVTRLPLDRRTIADALKAAGYATGMFGKWHLGSGPRYHPSQRGFDEAIVSMGEHVNFTTMPEVDHPGDQFLVDFLTERSVDFIERHKDRPFFLYLAHYSVHAPLEAPHDLAEKYRGKEPIGGHSNPVYAAMIEYVDHSVGRIMAKLDELQLAGNTLVIFTSDNGGVGGYDDRFDNYTDNAPLRSGKGTFYEGGLRAPLIVRWPGVTPAGATCEAVTTHVDFFPTTLEAAGAAAPETQTLDGLSIVPLLRDPAGQLEREAIYGHFPGYLQGFGEGVWRTTPVGMIRAGDWKLIEFLEDGRLELYNLREDIGERNDLASTMPEKVRELHAMLIAWRERTGAAMPRPKNPERD
ncbi:MAG: sulfatase [Phycisphaeraceae bacterium]|nr:MAG: sulfatase [Phycisphaeraceae bacterium]